MQNELMQTAAVILAAGMSKRFGSSKPLAPIGRRTLLEAVVMLARGSGLDPVISVVPPGLAVPAGVLPALNSAPSSGLSHSLRIGLAAVPAEIEAALILLGDQPTMALRTVRAVLAGAANDRRVVAARAEGRLGPPVLLRREAFAMANAAMGDEGLRAILIDHPDLVTAVDVQLHAPDVDTLADLAALGEPCPGCDALFQPVRQDATHEYIGASPACWAAFGEVLAREFGDPRYGWIHRHTVDVYTVQHPGLDERRQRQSVALHLIGLCHWLEHGKGMRELNPITERLASGGGDWPWLDPPVTYALTVRDVLDATTSAEHGALVRQWAEETWRAWAPHHELIRRWASEALH